jgi:hypothetical protein
VLDRRQRLRDARGIDTARPEAASDVVAADIDRDQRHMPAVGPKETERRRVLAI